LRKIILDSFLKRIEKAKIGVDESIYQTIEQELKEINSLKKEMERKIGRSVTEFNDTIFWDEISNNKDFIGILKLTHGYSGSDLERGMRVALFKAIHTELLTYDVLYKSLDLVGGTSEHLEDYEASKNPKINGSFKKDFGKKNDSKPKPLEI